MIRREVLQGLGALALWPASVPVRHQLASRRMAHGASTADVAALSDAAAEFAALARHGVDADYRVTDALGELRDLKGSRIHASVATLVAGHFHERHLLHLTPEARVVFARRGSVFRS